MTTSPPPTGRIWFPGNPWPQGHRLTELRWVGDLQPGRGLAIGFELHTAPYYEDDGGPTTQLDRTLLAGDDGSGWTLAYSWSNYHRASITPSATSNRPGVLVSDGSSPFSFGEPAYRFRADPAPLDWDTFWESNAFSIYLLGHDACADHHIRLERTPDGAYDLHWTGRIALAYGGSTELDHTFEVRASGVTFDAIHLGRCEGEGDAGAIPPNRPGDERDRQLLATLAPYVTAPERFRLERRHGRPFAVYG